MQENKPTNTIGIFTAVYDGYEKYLPRWEASIRALERPVDQVVIIGDDAAREAWQGTGEFILAPEYGNPYKQVASYNRAVAALTTDWVMHIGSDDVADVRLTKLFTRYFSQADVIAFDSILRKDGAFVRMRRNRPTAEKIMAETMGGQALDACALYRRSLWEQRPYNQDMEGASDVALWIEFAKLGARFAYTAQIGMTYILHDDSL